MRGERGLHIGRTMVAYMTHAVRWSCDECALVEQRANAFASCLLEIVPNAFTPLHCTHDASIILPLKNAMYCWSQSEMIVALSFRTTSLTNSQKLLVIFIF
jgi:hypothetical protein